MNKEQKNYSDACMYKAFMTRAFRSEPDFKNGTDKGEFRLLEHIENGHYGKPADYAKQVKKLKAYLSKSVEKVLKWKLTSLERSEVEFYAEMSEHASDGNSLAVAINGLLVVTHRFKAD